MKKTFDAVAWMRQRRKQIDEEDAALSWAQKWQKTHEEVLRDQLFSPLCVQSEKADLRTGKRILSSHHQRRGR